VGDISDANDPGHELLTDESTVQQVRGQDGPEEEEQRIPHLVSSKAF